MKRLLIPIIILVVLLAAYLIVQNNKTQSVTVDRIENFLNLSAQDVTSLNIERMGSPELEFRRDGVDWLVMDDSVERLADTSLVNDIVTMFADLEVGEVESDNPKKQGLYQVDTLTGTRITFYKNQEELSSIIVGSSSQGYLYSYVRKPDSDLVYSGKGVKSFLLTKPIAAFRNKNIIQADTAGIVSLVFEYPEESFTVSRGDSLWYLNMADADEKTPVNSDTLDLVKRQFVVLRADGFWIDSDSAIPVDKTPELTLTVNYQNGQSDRLRLLGGNDSKTRYFIQRDGVNDTYMIVYSKYGQLIRRSNNFLAVEKNG